MSFGDRRELLKQKLWLAIDGLSDSDGFVLTATADDIVFTKLASAGWDERILELEPLVIAELDRDIQHRYEMKRTLQSEQASLSSKISAKKRELAQIEAAIAKLTNQGVDHHE